MKKCVMKVGGIGLKLVPDRYHSNLTGYLKEYFFSKLTLIKRTGDEFKRFLLFS